ncbi:MAG: hypothetical protein H0S80_01415 [Desulfovibrionaceae bacterium]|nr:hypothetical protein [Desulfovibrionaceae bacterium]
MKFARPSLQISILTLFMVLLLVSSGTLTWFNYKENSETAMDIARQLVHEVSQKVQQRVGCMFEDIQLRTLEVSELLQFIPKSRVMDHGILWFMAKSLLSHERVYSMYVGYSGGDFYQVISLRNADQALRSRLGAPASAELAVRRVHSRPEDGSRVEVVQFFDADRVMVDSRFEEEAAFDPRLRPWYWQAVSSPEVVHTPFYVFASSKKLGLTVAHRFGGAVPGVFGMDITLNDMSSFFAEQNVGKSGGLVFLFDSKGRLTAYPDPNKTVYLEPGLDGIKLRQATLDRTGVPLLSDLWERVKRNGIEEAVLLKGSYGRYFVHVSPVRDAHFGDQYVAVAARMSDFTERMDETRRISLIFALGMALLAIPMAMYFSRMIARPLTKLANEADEIRRFRLDSPVEVDSMIAEVANLSRAIKTMKSSLNIFGKYVPKALVQRLLRSNLEARLGGDRRELTLLFSDIEDFTRFAEGLEPEDLMLRVSDYLQVVGSEILKTDGTIDKFIGDAVMAFWNAPVSQEDHAVRACEAALRAQLANRELNRRMEAEGLPPLRTRFGLHTGEAVVGNIGSEDRINYTAVGAAVNLAARLEGLNKYYGTDILVSETVRAKAGDEFLFRTVGMALAKGTTRPVRVYELLGVPQDSGSELAACGLRCTRLDDWEQAHAAYLERRFGEAARMFADLAEHDPEDRLAVLLMEKSRQYEAEPPGPDWNGVDVFKTK